MCVDGYVGMATCRIWILRLQSDQGNVEMFGYETCVISFACGMLMGMV